jgi:hypothetical protein
MKGKMLVEIITEDTSKKIITERTEPVTTAKGIVKHKHNHRAKQRIDDTHYQEGKESLIEYITPHKALFLSFAKLRKNERRTKQTCLFFRKHSCNSLT